MSRYVLNLSRIAALLLCLGRTSVATSQDELEVNCARPSSGTVGEEYACIDATITDGTMTIRAGSFTTRNLDLDQGEWRMSGGVDIVSAEAELDADSVVVMRTDGSFVSFDLSGSPARMTHFAGENETPVSAEAERIHYEVPTELLQISGDVRFAFGENVFNTCELSYNLGERSYRTGDCGVRATLRQPESDQDSSATQRGEP